MINFVFTERPSNSPFVEFVWRTRSENAGSFISPANVHSELVVTRSRDTITVTMRGPETKATVAECPAEAEFLGIVFKPGVYMPQLPLHSIRDRQDEILPMATGNAFWLDSTTWELPDYENADTFVRRLTHDEVLVCDPIVEAALAGRPQDVSERTVQRHFLRATGLTQNLIFQIERAKQALSLLRKGVSIMDTVHQTGYYDQPHLTRSLKRFLGQTPSQITRLTHSE